MEMMCLTVTISFQMSLEKTPLSILYYSMYCVLYCLFIDLLLSKSKSYFWIECWLKEEEEECFDCAQRERKTEENNK